MKRYIKPNTEVHEMELQQMIAMSNQDEKSNQPQLGRDNRLFDWDDDYSDEEE
ncbi:MAG: hypothetical protein IJV19_04535 [Prevotella sp.]|nr:hypothetical protein [Prevotella sp.]